MAEVSVVEVAKGLEGVVVDQTSICLVDRATDRLYYRGYPIEEMAQLSYEAVSWLLVHGELPDAAQLEGYRSRLRELRSLPPALCMVLEQIPASTDPMEMLRSACSVLGNLEPETEERNLNEVAARLTAALPSMLLYWHHYHQSGTRIDTRSDEPTVAGHLLRQLHGKASDELLRRALDVSLIMYAEHDFNASTFTARIATSTLSDGYSAVVAALSTLRGPLHGSANANVLRFLQRFENADAAERAIPEMLAKKTRIPGFGQRAYVSADPRNAIHREWAQKLAEHSGNRALYETAERVESLLLRERRMFANLDYYSALIYHECGLPIPLFPPMFFIARICGLVAHITEQRASNRLIHPSSRYVGPPPRHVEAAQATPAQVKAAI